MSSLTADLRISPRLTKISLHCESEGWSEKSGFPEDRGDRRLDGARSLCGGRICTRHIPGTSVKGYRSRDGRKRHRTCHKSGSRAWSQDKSKRFRDLRHRSGEVGRPRTWVRRCQARVLFTREPQSDCGGRNSWGWPEPTRLYGQRHGHMSERRPFRRTCRSLLRHCRSS